MIALYDSFTLMEALQKKIVGFSDRLGQIIQDEWEDNAALFARSAGISDSLVRKYLKGESEPGLSKLVAIAETASVSLEWLATNQGSMRTQQKNGGASEPLLSYLSKGIPKGVSFESLTFVPIYDDVLSAGSGAEGSNAQLMGHSALATDWLRNIARIEPARAFMAQVRGLSMVNLLEDGDLVLGELTATVEHDDIYAVRHWESVLVKHVSRQGNSITLSSENKSYPSITLTKPSIEEFGVIGRIVRKLVRLNM